MSVLFDTIMENNNIYGTTANGAKTLLSSGNELVDLFAAIGSSRGKDVSSLFVKAFGDNDVTNALAVRILLWSRDVRGGAGERHTFRSLVPYVEMESIDLTRAIIRKIPEVGRWDDMFCFTAPYAVDYANQVIADALFAGNGLCAKWMPRKGDIAIRLRKFLGLSPKEYRKMIVGLTNVVEQQMCSKDWDKINYEHVPSVASGRYQKAFGRNDGERYAQYLAALEKGETKVNAGALFPHDVTKLAYSNDKLANAQWKALPDYLEGSTENLLCVVDVSGSMNCPVGGSGSLQCMDVSIALGMYVAERSKGIFKDQFITFHSNPSFVKLEGDLKKRLRTTQNASWGGSTDLQKTFEVILNAAVKNKISEKDMPTKLIIFSDMEFNMACKNGGLTNFKAIEKKYKDAGYKRPDIIFWNLNARSGNSPVSFAQHGTALVSGFSPSLMKSILSGKNVTPFDIMMEAIMSDRYNLV